MSKKAEKKNQEKIIQDHTFGLKNKNKSKVVQKFIQGVAAQVKNKGQSMTKLEADKFEEKRRKKQEEEENALLASIYKTVESIAGQEEEEEEDDDRDPKTIVCAYFKQGLCQKGRKCKYSHDMSLENKAEILDVYTDQREQMYGDDDLDSCANWDETTLKDIVEANQKKYKSQIPSDIVCKFFLDALEKGKYGWKWVCPNGMTCHYRHCLPQGFVFKKSVQKEENRSVEQLLEDVIDQQRESLTSKGTKITKEVFQKWKEDRAKRKEQDKDKKEVEQKKKGAKGVNFNLSGRALFQYDPSVFVDDEEAVEGDIYQEREGDEEDEMSTTSGARQIAEEENEDDDDQKQETQFQQQQEQFQQQKQVNFQDAQNDQKNDNEGQKNKQKKKKKQNGANGVQINEQAFEDDDG